MDLDKRLDVNVKARRVPRFKAGSELSSSKSIIDVDVDHEIGEDQEVIELKLSLINRKDIAYPDVN